MSFRGGLLCVCTVVIAGISPSNALASGEFEPNDTFNTAVGPIFSGANVPGTFETSNDEDIFFFYLPQQTQLRYQLKNTTSHTSLVCSSIYQQTASGPDYISDTALKVYAGETNSGAITLGPGKYYFDVYCSDTGETYNFRLDPPGVTSTYEPFALACAAAHPAVEITSRKLVRAKAKVAKAKARRNRAKVSKRRAKVRVRKGEFEAAVRAEADACSVPQ